MRTTGGPANYSTAPQQQPDIEGKKSDGGGWGLAHDFINVVYTNKRSESALEVRTRVPLGVARVAAGCRYNGLIPAGVSGRTRQPAHAGPAPGVPGAQNWA